MFRKCIFYKKVHFFLHFFSLKICIYQKFVVILHRLLKMTPKQTELENQKFEKL